MVWIHKPSDICASRGISSCVFRRIQFRGFSMEFPIYNRFEQNTQKQLHARKGNAKSSLIKIETPDVTKFSNTCNFMVSNKQ